ncbi:sigma-70 family RNA polymerase sigma factor [Nocardia mexicana]|uniref:RNA polymerase sigma-70 factor (ECF subfamily) n=1 Tax=Nocardia mexicana TaxID=279262 RepID=A0A370H9P7_9NOCA|nr:sigma-70 family RNA polymerase sigma factor [Nocardia mexicana]RDI51031.1 RNA polymerase sigma-70 factor (ECF subfamily) [Nocardia mexicana]
MSVLVPVRPARWSYATRTPGSAPYRRRSDVPDPDAELVRRVGTGDREAFDQLYRRTRPMVFRRVLAVVRDPGYAEETCQDVYIQVWRSAAGFDEQRGSAATWLRTLAHRQAVDRVRHERASSDHNHAWGASDYRPPIDAVVEEALRRHELRCVRSGLTTLTPLQRESLVLAYYVGFTYPQVAAHLGVQVSTVKSRIRAALARLETALAEASS